MFKRCRYRVEMERVEAGLTRDRATPVAGIRERGTHNHLSVRAPKVAIRTLMGLFLGGSWASDRGSPSNAEAQGPRRGELLSVAQRSHFAGSSPCRFSGFKASSVSDRATTTSDPCFAGRGFLRAVKRPSNVKRQRMSEVCTHRLVRRALRPSAPSAGLSASATCASCQYRSPQ